MSIFEYNGSALVAMVGKNCFAIASDRRLGVQLQTIATDFQRIYQIHDRLFIGISGLATDAQTLYQRLVFRHKLYELREERDMKPETFASLVSALLYEKRFGPYVYPSLFGFLYQRWPHLCNQQKNKDMGGGVCSGTWGSVRAEEELGPRSSTCDRGIRTIKSLLDERPEGSTVLWSIGGRRSLGLTGWVRCDVRSMDSSWISTGSCSSCDERSGVTACDGLCSNNAVSWKRRRTVSSRSRDEQPLRCWFSIAAMERRPTILTIAGAPTNFSVDDGGRSTLASLLNPCNRDCDGSRDPSRQNLTIFIASSVTNGGNRRCRRR
ncbi:hypothetical protein LWI29_011308 [Acer saccharum]|uniref:Proteasome subunit beta n=1 Tax=Acer saccharum TaxID=4024 RepID=A0AA39RKW6_ACESA|nr:hypothetical protein LWI29_011308 [Acer saccharum]